MCDCLFVLMVLHNVYERMKPSAHRECLIRIVKPMRIQHISLSYNRIVRSCSLLLTAFHIHIAFYCGGHLPWNEYICMKKRENYDILSIREISSCTATFGRFLPTCIRRQHTSPMVLTKPIVAAHYCCCVHLNYDDHLSLFRLEVYSFISLIIFFVRCFLNLKTFVCFLPTSNRYLIVWFFPWEREKRRQKLHKNVNKRWTRIMLQLCILCMLKHRWTALPSLGLPKKTAATNSYNPLVTPTWHQFLRLRKIIQFIFAIF